MSQGEGPRCGFDADGRDQPCQRVTDGGRCRDHKKEARETVNHIKKEFLAYFRGKKGPGAITLARAAKKAGREVAPGRYANLGRATIARWRNRDEKFDQKVRAAKQRQRHLRVQAVEEAVFKQIIEGNAAASLAIFYLINRAPEEWKDKSEVHQLLGESGEGVDELDVERERLAEAHRILAGESDANGQTETGGTDASHTG